MDSRLLDRFPDSKEEHLEKVRSERPDLFVHAGDWSQHSKVLRDGLPKLPDCDVRAQLLGFEPGTALLCFKGSLSAEPALLFVTDEVRKKK